MHLGLETILTPKYILLLFQNLQDLAEDLSSQLTPLFLLLVLYLYLLASSQCEHKGSVAEVHIDHEVVVGNRGDDVLLTCDYTVTPPSKCQVVS